jgi:aryl-alcohol dehydrogenase-like predicted oxidoreductase
MNIKRREFLKQSALGVGGVLVGSRIAHAATKPATFDPYELVTLGKSNLKVSRLCLGTGVKASARESAATRLGKLKFETVVKGAYDRGVRMFDLADLYGTNSFVVPALTGIARDQFSLVTKIWFRPGGIPEPERPAPEVVVNRFLKEMQTDYIDLLLFHCCVSPTWNDELHRQMETLSRYKEKGIVRAVGVSCHSLTALQTAANEPWVDSVHARINPFGMSMDGPPESVIPVLRKIHDAGKGVVGMKIVGEGKLRNDSARLDESIRFALQLGCVDVLNVGCENLQELDDMAARVARVARAAGA